MEAQTLTLVDWLMRLKSSKQHTRDCEHIRQIICKRKLILIFMVTTPSHGYQYYSVA